MTKQQVQIVKKNRSNAIIQIDDTHGLNKMNCKLTSVHVKDEFHQGLPIAFLLSHKVDTDTIKEFLSGLKVVVGRIKASVFMSDLVNTFYNAWCQVMVDCNEPPPIRLWCSWHVVRAISKNCRSKIKSSEVINGKKVDHSIQVMKQFLDLRDELNRNVFFTKLNAFLNFVKQFDQFHNYFTTYYLDQYQLWAYCFRTHLKINVNMTIENYHFILKDSYFLRKKAFRMDKCIHLILLHLHDRLDQRSNDLERGKKTRKSTQSFKNHKLAKQLLLDDLYEFDVSGGSFIKVKRKDENDDGNLVIIQEVSEHNCQLKCVFCSNCICSTFCDCHEHSLEYNFCVHAHLVLQHLKQLREANSSNDLPNEIDGEETDDETETDLNEEFEFDYEFNDGQSVDESSVLNEKDENEMRKILNDKVRMINDEILKPDFKLTDFKFKVMNRQLNDLLTTSKQDIECDSLDFFRSPSKKSKMIEQNRSY